MSGYKNIEYNKMGNMSYCRFENTARDLKDCVDAIQNQEMEDLSSYELRGLKDLLEYCRTILHFEDDIIEIVENE